MKCSNNDCTVHTVGEVRRCPRCQDGTAQQIPASLEDGAPLEAAIAAVPGLGNRFKPGGAPAPVAEQPAKDEQPPEPEPKQEQAEGTATEGADQAPAADAAAGAQPESTTAAEPGDQQ